jgi:hypothetical protein
LAIVSFWVRGFPLSAGRRRDTACVEIIGSTEVPPLDRILAALARWSDMMR